MTLAEALSEFADKKRRLAELSPRITDSMTYQEGDEPAEDTRALLEQAEAELDAIEKLTARINKTNAATVVADGKTLTHLLAEREKQRGLNKLYSHVAGATSRSFGYGGYGRQTRTELRTMVAVPAPELHSKADAAAQEHRRLDALIQKANWETELAG